jgi:hypothetical protein
VTSAAEEACKPYLGGTDAQHGRHPAHGPLGLSRLLRADVRAIFASAFAAESLVDYRRGRRARERHVAFRGQVGCQRRTGEHVL